MKNKNGTKWMYIVAALAATMTVLVLAPTTMACTTVVVFDDPTWNGEYYNVEYFPVNAHYWNLGDGEVVELFGNRGNDQRPWRLGVFSKDGCASQGTLTVQTGVGCCNDCGSDTFVFYAAKKRSDAKCGVVEFFGNMSEFLRNYNIVGITMFQRPCTMPTATLAPNLAITNAWMGICEGKNELYIEGEKEFLPTGYDIYVFTRAIQDPEDWPSWYPQMIPARIDGNKFYSQMTPGATTTLISRAFVMPQGSPIKDGQGHTLENIRAMGVIKESEDFTCERSYDIQ